MGKTFKDRKKHHSYENSNSFKKQKKKPQQWNRNNQEDQRIQELNLLAQIERDLKKEK